MCSTREYRTDIFPSVLAVIHHLTSLATRLHEDLYVDILSSVRVQRNSSIGRNLADANGRDSETSDKVTFVHPHPRPET